MSVTQNDRAAKPEYHPVFLHGRREMVFIVLVYLGAMLWTVPYCYLYGYPAQAEDFGPEKLETVMGLPSWVFWGVVIPWLTANVITTFFCFFFMKDDDLGPSHEGADLAEEIAEMRAREEQA